MQYTILIVTFLIVAGLASDCTPTDGNATEKPIPGETASMQRGKVKTELKETARSMQDYTYAQKDEFVTETKTELAEIQIELDRLAARVDRSKGTAKADAEFRIAAVRETWARAKNQLDQAESVTEATWNDVKRGLQKSRDGLKESFEQTRQWLSDEIEP
jgi:hypothetical protein